MFATEREAMQDLYNTVRAHLLTQGRRSVTDPDSEDGMYHCAYRGADGLTCAIGCLIPDEKYSPDMEGKSIIYIKDHYEGAIPEKYAEWLVEHEPNLAGMNGLTRDLQELHDEADEGDDIHDWAEALDTVAMDYDLAVGTEDVADVCN